VSAAHWERVYQQERARVTPSQTRNAIACRKRRESLRAQGLCIFCGHHPATALCEECQRTQGEQRRAKYRQAVEEMGRTVRPYRRKGVA
jgi:hypothetical protein